MPSIGPLEILMVATVALIVFGPEKLPEIARTIGRTAQHLRRAASDLKEEFDVALELDDDEETAQAPPRRPRRAAGARRAGADDRERSDRPPVTEAEPAERSSPPANADGEHSDPQPRSSRPDGS